MHSRRPSGRLLCVKGRGCPGRYLEHAPIPPAGPVPRRPAPRRAGRRLSRRRTAAGHRGSDVPGQVAHRDAARLPHQPQPGACRRQDRAEAPGDPPHAPPAALHGAGPGQDALRDLLLLPRQGHRRPGRGPGRPDGADLHRRADRGRLRPREVRRHLRLPVGDRDLHRVVPGAAAPDPRPLLARSPRHRRRDELPPVLPAVRPRASRVGGVAVLPAARVPAGEAAHPRPAPACESRPARVPAAHRGARPRAPGAGGRARRPQPAPGERPRRRHRVGPGRLQAPARTGHLLLLARPPRHVWPDRVSGLRAVRGHLVGIVELPARGAGGHDRLRRSDRRGARRLRHAPARRPRRPAPRSPARLAVGRLPVQPARAWSRARTTAWWRCSWC